MFLLLCSCLYLNTFPSIVYHSKYSLSIHNITICLFWTRGQTQGTQESMVYRDPERDPGIPGIRKNTCKGSRDPCFAGIRQGSREGSRDPLKYMQGIQEVVFCRDPRSTVGSRKSCFAGIQVQL